MATTKITKGGSFLRSVKYALQNGKNKEEQQKITELPATKNETVVEGFEQGKRARLLATNVIGDSIPELAEQFDIVAKQRPDKKQAVHKVSISLKPGEHLETYQWLEVARSYLQTMGYEDCPFLIAQHREKEHDHIHIVTSKVKFNGEVVSELFEELNARKWALQIEEMYGLSPTSAKADEKGLTRVEIEQALKSKSPPPKLILQESIKRALESNKETPDFIDALHKQNISIRVKTSPEKEIIGVSFGLNGRGFKGSSLGAKFTWTGLQKNGLNYELQRDYERLEEASRRAGRTKSEPERVSEINAGIIARGSDGQSRHVNNNVVIRIPKPNRVHGGESAGRETERQSVATARSEFGNEGGRNSASTESVSPPAAEREQFAEAGNGAAQTADQGQLRRVGQFNSGKIQTIERAEPEIVEDQTIAAAEAIFAESENRQTNTGIEYEADDFFRQQELIQQSELFNQPSISNLLPAGESDKFIQPAVAQQNDISNFPGTGNYSAALDGSNRVDTERNLPDTLADSSALAGALDNNQINTVSIDNIAGNNYGAGTNGLRGSNTSTGDLGSSLLDERRDESRQDESLNLSDKLRQSLNEAESITKQTLSIQEEYEAREAEKEELKKQDFEMEEEVARVLTM